MNLQQFIEKVESAKFKVSNDKLNQVERNTLKADFMGVLVEIFADLGVELQHTTEGLVLTIENQEHNIYIQLDSAIKNLDYDLSGAIDEYASKLSDRAEREKALAEKKEKALLEKTKSKK